MNIPNHIAIILDGNGRWAKSKGMPRNYGHAQGSKNLEMICEEAYKLGVNYLTVYAFSTENWKRSPDEINGLMKLFRSYLKTCLKTAAKNDMCVKIIGDKSGFEQDMQARMSELEEATKQNKGLHFQVALNYGSRDEMIRAIKSLASDVLAKEITVDTITEEIFEGYLDTNEIPNPELMIRTSGEQRLSNFLLWQLAYTELYYTEVHWPDFSKDELVKAIMAYNKRDRRFGSTEEEGNVCK